MDDADLDNRTQRTADWLRRGINPNSNGTESDIAQGLDKLSQQLQQAQKGIGQGKFSQPGTAPGDQTAALNQIERLREQIESMARSQSNNGRPGSIGNQPGGKQFDPKAQLARNGPSRLKGRGANGSQQASNPSGQNGQGQRGANSSQPSGDVGTSLEPDQAAIRAPLALSVATAPRGTTSTPAITATASRASPPRLPMPPGILQTKNAPITRRCVS